MIKAVVIALVAGLGFCGTVKVSENFWDDYNTQYKKEMHQKEELVHKVHRLANSVIIARDNLKYGELEASPENLDDVIKQIEETDGWLKMRVLDSLKEWRKGNFVDTVKVHNIIWNKLEGNIGKAIDVDQAEVDRLLEKYDYNK